MIDAFFRKKYKLTIKQQKQINSIIELEKNQSYSDGYNKGYFEGKKDQEKATTSISPEERQKIITVITELSKQSENLARIFIEGFRP